MLMELWQGGRAESKGECVWKRGRERGGAMGRQLLTWVMVGSGATTVVARDHHHDNNSHHMDSAKDMVRRFLRSARLRIWWHGRQW